MTMAAISAVMEKVATVGNAHDFASAACGVHVGDGRGNRTKTIGTTIQNIKLMKRSPSGFNPLALL